MSDTVKDAKEFLRLSSYVILGTVENETPFLRAMSIARIEDDFTIWFATDKSSNKIRQIFSNQNVCITTCTENRSLRLFGEAEIIQKKETLHALWQDSYEPYFKGGKDDPEYTLIRVKPTGVEYEDFEKFGFTTQKLL